MENSTNENIPKSKTRRSLSNVKLATYYRWWKSKRLEATCDTYSTSFLHGCQLAGYKVLCKGKEDDNAAGNQSTPTDEEKQHHKSQQCLQTTRNVFVTRNELKYFQKIVQKIITINLNLFCVLLFVIILQNLRIIIPNIICQCHVHQCIKQKLYRKTPWIELRLVLKRWNRTTL